MTRVRFAIRVLGAGAFGVAAACASAPSSPAARYVTMAGDAPETGPTQRLSAVIRTSELAEIRSYSALDAIRQLRPEFLRSSPVLHIGAAPATPVVYLDDRRFGGVDALDALSLTGVIEIRYYAPMVAMTTLGSSCSCDGGVIVVMTRRDHK